MPPGLMGRIGGSQQQSVSSLLKSLVQHTCPGIDDSQQSTLHAFAVGMLSRSVQPVSPVDEDDKSEEAVVLERIKRYLAAQGNPRDSVIFSELHVKASRTGAPNIRPMLSLIYEIASKSQTPSSSLSIVANDSFLHSAFRHSQSESSQHMKNGGGPIRSSQPSVRQRPLVPPPSSSSRALSTRNSENRVSSMNDSQSAYLTREILYVFQGIPGSLIQFSSTESKFVIKPDLAVPSSVKIHVDKLCTIGWLYSKIRKFLETKNADKTYGLIGHSLCAALQQEMTEFDRLIAVLESQVNVSESAGEGTPAGLSLSQLDVWMFEPSFRLKMMAALVEENCRNKKGGALLTAVHSFGFHGDPAVKALTRKLLHCMLHPLQCMIVDWLCSGHLTDNHIEFFISENPAVKYEKMWQDKYSLRKGMVPCFISEQQCAKILLVGKSLNFIRQVCKDNSALDFLQHGPNAEEKKREHYQALLKENFDVNLQKMIVESEGTVNSVLLDLLMKKYKLMDHLQAFRRYLLFGQGDFIRHLMDVLGSELDRPATELFKHSLRSSMESAIRATNAKFDEPDVLDRLDVRLLEWSPGDVGWDVFSLHYHVSGGPLPTIFTNQCVLLYLRIFNFLWRAKRIEFVLSHIWIEQISYARILSCMPQLVPIIHKCKILHHNMTNFVHQMQYYLMFEVLECSWAELVERVEKSPNLDHIIAAHQTFLDAILSGALLEDKLHTLLTQMRAIFDIIVQYQHMQARFFEAALNEVFASKQYAQTIRENSLMGEWGTTDVSEEEQNARTRHFIKEVLPKTRAEIKIISTSFRDMVINFLVSLHEQQDENMQFLSYRLDFNDYYRELDSRLKPTRLSLPASGISTGFGGGRTR